MTTLRIERTRRSASRLVSSSTWRTMRALSWRACSSTSRSRTCLACDALRWAMRSSSRRCSRLRSSSSSRSRSSSRARSSSASLAPGELGEPRLERLLLGQRALLDARDLRTALAQLGVDDLRGRERRSAPTPAARLRRGRLAPSALARSGASGAAASTSPTARSAAAMTIAMTVLSREARLRAGPGQLSVVVRQTGPCEEHVLAMVGGLRRRLQSRLGASSGRELCSRHAACRRGEAVNVEGSARD